MDRTLGSLILLSVLLLGPVLFESRRNLPQMQLAWLGAAVFGLGLKGHNFGIRVLGFSVSGRAFRKRIAALGFQGLHHGGLLKEGTPEDSMSIGLSRD